MRETRIFREMDLKDLDAVVGLQRECFPPPFPESLLWNSAHLEHHLSIFPEGQFVAEIDGQVVGSASNTLISESHFQKHLNWDMTVGGYFLETFMSTGSTLYGLDISIHPAFRKQGLAKGLYDKRFNLVRMRLATRYSTSCRLPDFSAWSEGNESLLDDYLTAVKDGSTLDRTLTPLLRLNLNIVSGLREYMDDSESLNCAALLEWKP